MREVRLALALLEKQMTDTWNMEDRAHYQSCSLIIQVRVVVTDASTILREDIISSLASLCLLCLTGWTCYPL